MSEWCYTCNDEKYTCNCIHEDYFYGSKNLGVPKDIHVMNKDEAKLCRKLMSETGLSEEELREHKKYRIMLSEAQKLGSKELAYSAKHNRTKKRLMKQATKRTGLAKAHPETQKIYKELVESTNRWWHYFR